jgi:hypothetical protein
MMSPILGITMKKVQQLACHPFSRWTSLVVATFLNKCVAKIQFAVKVSPSVQVREVPIALER